MLGSNIQKNSRNINAGQDKKEKIYINVSLQNNKYRIKLRGKTKFHKEVFFLLNSFSNNTKLRFYHFYDTITMILKI